MDLNSASRWGRVKWVVAFAALLCLTSAIGPVIARSDTEPSPISGAPATAEESPPNGPDSEEIVTLLQAAAEEEEEREEQLARPAAVEEREASRRAYANFDAAEAQELLRTEFPQALASLNADPARALSNARLDRPIGEDDAVVTTEGKTQLLEGSAPVVAENAEGEMEKVDVSLERTSEGYAPENPVVELAIAESAAEGITIGGEEGGEAARPITVTQVGAEGSTAQPFGDKNVFFGEVEPGSDTDQLVAPKAAGVEIFDMLRSVDSPQTLRFRLELPAGAQLRANAGGGAEVVSEAGSALYEIPRPVSTDAQGSQVPTSLEVEGDMVVLHVQHREQEVAYPILVDPEWVFENWNTGNLPGIPPWVPYQSASGNGISYGTEDTQWPGAHGLFFAAQPGYLAPGAWTELAYFAPNVHTYIAKAVINTFWRGDSCSPLVKDPYDYDGMYVYSENGTSVSAHWNGYRVNDAYYLGNSTVESWGNEFIFGYGNSTGQYNACWRNVMNGGSQIWLEDWQYPYINSSTAPPSGWVKKDATQRTINVSASDEGLGVRVVRMIAPGSKKETNWNTPLCAGTYESPCPNSASGVITYETSQFPLEGEAIVGLVVEDPTKKTWSEEFPMKLDGAPPAITLSGQLAEVTKEEGSTENPNQAAGEDKLRLPVYNLKIKAEDKISSGAAGSGVKEIKLSLDGKPLTAKGPTCSASSCPSSYEWTYPLALTALSEGGHTLEVGAVDFTGNEIEPKYRKINFEYIPATGMKEEYVLQHFVLPDGHSYEGEDYEGPELAVNVTNGNVVFRQRDLRAEAPDGHFLELEPIYNSQQPLARDGQWGHGWSLAQTPEFKAESGSAPKTATMVRTSAITSAVQLPESQTQTTFSSALHATIGKTSSGGYEVRSATAEETSLFNSSGRIEETRFSSASPEATATPEPVFPAFAESLGFTGSGNGQFNHPADAATDAKGDLWVVDKANNRIEEFNEAGELLRAAGSTGSGAGQLSSPSGIALDSYGDLDVTDTANNRIVRFNEVGEFVSAVGANVNRTKVEAGGTLAEKNHCTASSGNVCQAGTAGSAEGLMSEPIGITTSGGGNFYVVERANSRVEKFNTNGELLAKFGSAGSEPGKLSEPTAIASSSVGGGYLWVADTGNNRVEEWTSSYSFVRAVGKEGSGQVEFKRPAAIEADAEGNVWVGDQGNERVQELSKSGDYLTQVGGQGQFGFSAPMGVFLTSAGELWVTDTEADQVQKWMTGASILAGTRVGSFGTGNSQFSHPADVAVDSKGNVWALDKGNNRLEKFNEKGEFLLAAGASGTGAGKLSAPAGLAVDPRGNAWVADTANNRIDEFNEKGEFVLTFGREVNKTKVETSGATEAEKSLCTAASGNVCQAGVAGAANGQLKAPQGIAATSSGNLWVADTGNNRIQKFGPTGTFMNAVTGSGTSGGPLKEPAAIAIAPDGSVWVADSANNRIEQWSTSLTLSRVVGSEGSGNEQFKRPAAIDVDSGGNVWVGDQSNQRLQEFSSSGAYLAKLGSAGQFAFSAPMGLASDGKGDVWVTDTDRSRIEKLPATEFAQPVVTKIAAVEFSFSAGNLSEMKLAEPGASEATSVAVETTSGLAAKASSKAGTATYSYSSGNLAAVKGPEGETTFQRDASNRITEVKLPNGTWAKVSYDSYGRATAVTVKPAGGEEKTTHFAYQLEPRKTTVWGIGVDEVVYYIGEDGSVFKWENAETPPAITSISGSLWGWRNKTEPMEPEHDQTLYVSAYSQHEIGSIKVLENGKTVLAETTCKDEAEPPAHNCDTPPPLEWITNPSEHAPGQLNLEVVATDFNHHSVAEKFFVTIPQPPPPSPEEVERPSFAATKKFREDYGLDREHPLTNQQMNTLVLELLYEWEMGKPTAVEAVDNWGVPMRAPELAEMEYRREYTDRAAEVVPLWAEEHASSTYGGFYVDDRAGGEIYVGFTENQAATVEALKQDLRLLNNAAIREYATPPKEPIHSLEATAETVTSAISSEPTIAQQTTSIHVADESNVIVVGATNPASVSDFLRSRFGGNAPIAVELEQPDVPAATRYAGSGPVVAGSAVVGLNNNVCTAGFGARAKAGEARGKAEYDYFVSTAGHCYPVNMIVERETKKFGYGPELGLVDRDPYWKTAVRTTDGARIAIDENLRSHSVLNGSPLEAQPIQGVQSPYRGEQVCWSGMYGGKQCGRVIWAAPSFIEGRLEYVYLAKGLTIQGDSGGPVWDPHTHKAVGLITAGSDEDSGLCRETSYGPVACDRMKFTPLLPAGGSYGIAPKLGIEILKQGS